MIRHAPAAWLALVLTAPASGAALDYCQYGSSTHLILVDRTTAYDAADEALFVSGLTRISRRLEAADSVGDRVIVQSIVGGVAQGDRPFDECVPGCRNDGLWDYLFGGCKDMQARAHRTDFVRQLVQIVRGVLGDVREYPRSDIARTITQVSRELAGGGFEQDKPHKPLGGVYVFSDLIENSDELPWPMVVTQPPERLVERLASRRLAPALDGATVYVFGYGRHHGKDRRSLSVDEDAQLRSFWKRYLQAGGALEVYIGQRLE